MRLFISNRASWLASLFCLPTMLAAGAGMAGSPQDVIIFDLGESPGQIAGPAKISNKEFRHFVTEVTGFVSTQFVVAAVGRYKSSAAPDLALTFIRMPVAASEEYRAGKFGQPASGAACSINSPWSNVEIIQGAKGALQIRGEFRWNERQFLRDGGGIRSSDIVHPLAPEVFERYAQEYAQTIPNQGKLTAAHRQMPADILWLFQTAWQSTRGPFIGNARNRMRKISVAAAEPYSKFVIGILGACLSGAADQVTYRSLADAPRSESLEAYVAILK